MKKLFVPILIIIVFSIAMSCSSSRTAVMAYDSAPPAPPGGLMAGNNNAVMETEKVEKKIIYSATLTLAVKNPDSTGAIIEKIAEKYEGYATELGSYRTVIRVKSEALDKALDEISLLGKVQSKNRTGQDVTDQYLDFKIRLENAEKARTRYLELLAKAENVEAALKVEKELERLNETIDMIKGKMNRIEHLSAYSTITIYLNEKKKPGVLGYVGIGLYHSVKWLFVRN